MKLFGFKNSNMVWLSVLVVTAIIWFLYIKPNMVEGYIPAPIPVMDKKVLVTDGNGKPIEKNVNIAYPETYQFYGHEFKPHTYQDFSYYCPKYPNKIEVDSVGGPFFLPKFCNVCE